jgi:hypothetical protein
MLQAWRFVGTLRQQLAMRVRACVDDCVLLCLPRMSEPTLGAPSWDHDPSFRAAGDAWPDPRHPQRLIHEAVWHWHLGHAANPSTFLPSATTESVSKLAEGLRSEDEMTALNCAYSLAKLGGEEAANALIAALPETTAAQKDWSGNGNGVGHCLCRHIAA